MNDIVVIDDWLFVAAILASLLVGLVLAYWIGRR